MNKSHDIASFCNFLWLWLPIKCYNASRIVYFKLGWRGLKDEGNNG